MQHTVWGDFDQRLYHVGRRQCARSVCIISASARSSGKWVMDVGIRPPLHAGASHKELFRHGHLLCALPGSLLSVLQHGLQHCPAGARIAATCHASAPHAVRQASGTKFTILLL